MARKESSTEKTGRTDFCLECGEPLDRENWLYEPYCSVCHLVAFWDEEQFFNDVKYFPDK